MHGHFTSRIQKICKLSSDESLIVANAMIKACKEAFPCLNRSDFLWNWPTHLTQIWVLIQAETTDNVTDESLTQIWVLRQAETVIAFEWSFSKAEQIHKVTNYFHSKWQLPCRQPKSEDFCSGCFHKSLVIWHLEWLEMLLLAV